MGDAEQTVVRVLPEIAEIGAEPWDACANPISSDIALEEPYNPFVSHAFLDALEKSGSISAEAGWAPQHLVMEDGADRALACMPCYLKGHSLGEYVFDHGWADAFERAGGDYYPKLQAAVPFTPVTGRRLLVPPGPDAEHRERVLVSAGTQLLERYEASSLHLTFSDQAGMDAAWGARPVATDRPAVPLAQRRLWNLRRLSRIARVAQAQGDPQRAARGPRRGHHDRMGDRFGSQRGLLGQLLRFLPRHGRAQMGQPLSQSGILQPPRRDHGGPHSAHPMPNATAGISVPR